jgi:arylsulfatase/uncharacterized sulfatase
VVYDEAVRVPLLLAWPGILPRGASLAPVALADVAPTILELVGVPDGGDGSGKSLTPLLLGGPFPWPRRLELEAEHSQPRIQRGVTDGRLKLVESGAGRQVRQRLFDLLRDPGETRDVLREHPGLAASLAADLPAPLRRVPPVPSLEAADVEALRALGYLD